MTNWLELQRFISFILTFFLCFGLLISVPENKPKTKCNLNVDIEQYLHNNGFHRNLSYVINFDTYDEDWTSSGDCHLGLEQVLPAGLYASPDEVAGHIAIKSPVNIEESADEAKEITIHLVSQVKQSVILLSLPVHARYHSATAGGGKVRQEIKPPKLYLNCLYNKLNCEEKEEVLNNFCKGSGTNCPWKKVPIIMTTAPVTWDVPVGNTDHYYIVAAGTALFTVLGSVYVLRTIHECTLITRRRKSKLK